MKAFSAFYARKGLFIWCNYGDEENVWYNKKVSIWM